MINDKIYKVLLERFGEPIGDTDTTVGVADEREDLDEVDPKGYSHKVRITHKDDDIDLMLDKMRDDEAIRKVGSAVYNWMYSKEACPDCGCLDASNNEQDGTFTCKDCNCNWMPENLDESEIDQVAPKGYEHVVKALKKDKEVDNPWAVAWSMKNKKDKKR